MTYEEENRKDRIVVTKYVVGIVAFIILLTLANMIFYPKYRIYKQDLQGQANLRQQEWEKMILIEEANAKNESATLEAQALIKQETARAEAEIIRAGGVAEANKIIAEGLKGNKEYLHYLWIQQLATSNTVYVPTEANLPILEARNTIN